MSKLQDKKLRKESEVRELPVSDAPTLPYSGSSTFYKILDEMAVTHNKKSHDYASDKQPYGNYKFAGRLGSLFHNPDDAGFLTRLGEKMYRLANIENNKKQVMNESIEDTENDLCVIMTLWMSMRRDRRK